MAAPTMALPACTAFTYAGRSMAMLKARRTLALSKGGRFVLRRRFSLTFVAVSELEGAGAQATRAVLGQRHVRGNDGRVAGGEHRQQRRLRALEPEDDGNGVGRLDGLDVGVPLFPGVQAKLRRRILRLAHEVEGELHVLGREGLPVVPARVLPEEEHEVPVVVLPRPTLGQLGYGRSVLGGRAWRPSCGDDSGIRAAPQAPSRQPACRRHGATAIIRTDVESPREEPFMRKTACVVIALLLTLAVFGSGLAA